jgi:hypothetical protein
MKKTCKRKRGKIRSKKIKTRKRKIHSRNRTRTRNRNRNRNRKKIKGGRKWQCIGYTEHGIKHSCDAEAWYFGIGPISAVTRAPSGWFNSRAFIYDSEEYLPTLIWGGPLEFSGKRTAGEDMESKMVLNADPSRIRCPLCYSKHISLNLSQSTTTMNRRGGGAAKPLLVAAAAATAANPAAAPLTAVGILSGGSPTSNSSTLVAYPEAGLGTNPSANKPNHFSRAELDNPLREISAINNVTTPNELVEGGPVNFEFNSRLLVRGASQSTHELLRNGVTLPRVYVYTSSGEKDQQSLDNLVKFIDDMDSQVEGGGGSFLFGKIPDIATADYSNSKIPIRDAPYLYIDEFNKSGKPKPVYQLMWLSDMNEVVILPHIYSHRGPQRTENDGPRGWRKSENIFEYPTTDPDKVKVQGANRLMHIGIKEEETTAAGEAIYFPGDDSINTVLFVDNNSGHYRTREAALYPLCDLLHHRLGIDVVPIPLSSVDFQKASVDDESERIDSHAISLRRVKSLMGNSTTLNRYITESKVAIKNFLDNYRTALWINGTTNTAALGEAVRMTRFPEYPPSSSPPAVNRASAGTHKQGKKKQKQEARREGHVRKAEAQAEAEAQGRAQAQAQAEAQARAKAEAERVAAEGGGGGAAGGGGGAAGGGGGGGVVDDTEYLWGQRAKFQGKQGGQHRSTKQKYLTKLLENFVSKSKEPAQIQIPSLAYLRGVDESSLTHQPERPDIDRAIAANQRRKQIGLYWEFPQDPNLVAIIGVGLGDKGRYAKNQYFRFDDTTITSVNKGDVWPLSLAPAQSFTL